MITYIGQHAIKSLANGRYAAYRFSGWFLGTFTSFAAAKKALNDQSIKGVYQSIF